MVPRKKHPKEGEKMNKKILVCLAVFVLALGTISPIVRAEDGMNICDFASQMKTFYVYIKATTSNTGNNSPITVDTAGQASVLLEQLCIRMPTADTIRYGAATQWFIAADDINARFVSGVMTALIKKETGGVELAVEALQFQTLLNEMRAKAYAIAQSKNVELPKKGLAITVNPWAFVLYNGKKASVDRTTPLVITDLKPGNYTFAFESSAFETIQRTITVMGVPQAIYVDLVEEAPTKTKLDH